MRLSKYDGGATPYELVEQYGYDWDAQMGDYPIWDESQREWLNGMIYDQFCYREIAQETGAQFFHYLNIRMWRVMPTVNAVAAAFLGDKAETDFKSTGVSKLEQHTTTDTAADGIAKADGKSDTTGSSTTESATESKSTVIASETPQVRLGGNENYMNALNETGAKGNGSGKDTQESHNTQSGNNETHDASHSEVDATATNTVIGGQVAALAASWIESAPDILGIVFDALEPLFVQVWD